MGLITRIADRIKRMDALDEQQAADRLGCDVEHLRYHVQDGLLKPLPGEPMRFTEEAVDECKAFFEDQRKHLDRLIAINEEFRELEQK